jgi:hypothetical protein
MSKGSDGQIDTGQGFSVSDLRTGLAFPATRMVKFSFVGLRNGGAGLLRWEAPIPIAIASLVGDLAGWN